MLMDRQSKEPMLKQQYGIDKLPRNIHVSTLEGLSLTIKKYTEYF